MYQVNNIHQIITFPTRYRNSQSSLLDLFLCSDYKSVFGLQSEPPIGKSDHIVITAKAQIKLPRRPTNKILRRNFYTADYQQINNFIMQQPIDGEEGKFERFEHVVKVAIEKHIPLKSVRVNSQKPWINETLFKQIDKK